MKVKSHTFNGRKYQIELEQSLDGVCDQYKCNERYISVFAKHHSQNELITIIHECLHAENWTKKEEPIDRISTEIGSLLWRLGYRRK